MDSIAIHYLRPWSVRFLYRSLYCTSFLTLQSQCQVSHKTNIYNYTIVFNFGNCKLISVSNAGSILKISTKGWITVIQNHMYAWLKIIKDKPFPFILWHKKNIRKKFNNYTSSHRIFTNSLSFLKKIKLTPTDLVLLINRRFILRKSMVNW